MFRMTAAVVTAALAVGSPAAAGPPRHHAVSYAALGDSYSSGVGAGPYQDATCKRSADSYAPQLAAAVRASTFTFLACAGALTAQVTAQAAAIPRRTTLVTVTTGGNDVGFSRSLGVCLNGTDADCAAAAEQARLVATTELPARLDAMYRAVRHRAPRATVVAGGYPRLFEEAEGCTTVPLSQAKREAVNGAVDVLNRTIRQRARKHHAAYANAARTFAGHGICAADPWLNGLVADGAFHPDTTGYADGYLKAFRRAVHLPKGQLPG